MHPILLQMKYTRVIAKFAEEEALPLYEAMVFFYSSLTYERMSTGLAQMHCRSDGYLVEELRQEFEERGRNTESASQSADGVCRADE